MELLQQNVTQNGLVGLRIVNHFQLVLGFFLDTLNLNGTKRKSFPGENFSWDAKSVPTRYLHFSLYAGT